MFWPCGDTCGRGLCLARNGRWRALVAEPPRQLIRQAVKLELVEQSARVVGIIIERARAFQIERHWDIGDNSREVFAVERLLAILREQQLSPSRQVVEMVKNVFERSIF